MEKENITSLPMVLSVRFGIRHTSIKALTMIKPGDVLELDQPSSKPFDLMVEGKIIGKCEVVSLDEKLGIRIVEIYDFPVDAI